MSKFLVNVCRSLALVAFALLPSWSCLLAYDLLSPGNFWQWFALSGFRFWIFGAVQFIFLFVLVPGLSEVWDPRP